MKNEYDWLTTNDAIAMSYKNGNHRDICFSHRQSLFICCAFLRTLWPKIRLDSCRKLIETSEQYLLGQVSGDAVDKANRIVNQEIHEIEQYTNSNNAMRQANYSDYDALSACSYLNYFPDSYPDHLVAYHYNYIAQETTAAGMDCSVQAAIVREVVGNPFRSTKIGKRCVNCNGLGGWYDGDEGQFVTHRDCNGLGIMPAIWLTPTVRQMAGIIMSEQTFEQLPILADMLEEGGCDQDELLHHLRGLERCPHGGWRPLSHPHVRGCWALEILKTKNHL